MNTDQLNQIIAAARAQLLEEQHRIAVDAELARLRARSNRSFWQRVADVLPFTITWKKS